MKLFTIGFTKKTAEEFFTTLQRAGVRRLMDVRLKNRSQLAGFSKREDLAYFTREICGVEYVHCPELAPAQGMLDAFRKEGGSWNVFARDFLALMAEREIENRLEPRSMDRACLLCSEEAPEHCHRRLIAEYLKEKWRGVKIEHLGLRK